LARFLPLDGVSVQSHLYLFPNFSSVGRPNPADLSVCADRPGFAEGDVFVTEAVNALTRGK
jgi:hypothetical protein